MDKSTVLKLLFPEQHTCSSMEHFIGFNRGKLQTWKKFSIQLPFTDGGERSDTKQKM